MDALVREDPALSFLKKAEIFSSQLLTVAHGTLVLLFGALLLAVLRD